MSLRAAPTSVLRSSRSGIKLLYLLSLGLQFSLIPEIRLHGLRRSKMSSRETA